MRTRNILMDNSKGKIYGNIPELGYLSLASIKINTLRLTPTWGAAAPSSINNLGGKGLFLPEKATIKNVEIGYGTTIFPSSYADNIKHKVSLKSTTNADSKYSNSVFLYDANWDVPKGSNKIYQISYLKITPSQPVVLSANNYLFVDLGIAAYNLNSTTMNHGYSMYININYYLG